MGSSPINATGAAGTTVAETDLPLPADAVPEPASAARAAINAMIGIRFPEVFLAISPSLSLSAVRA
jgi:hypothetical protein